MPWPIPNATAIADTTSSEMEWRLSTDQQGNPRPVDARSNRSILRVLAVVFGGALYPLYRFIAWCLRQWMPDTCDDADFLARHGSIWDVPRLAAIRAVGSVTFSGTPAVAIPAGTILTLSGTTWSTTAVATIGSGGTVSAPVLADVPGAASNIGAGTPIALQSPIIGLAVQTATVDTGGISGGADLESLEAWRGRILQRIREPAHGGAFFDYERWATEAIAPAAVRVYGNWIGKGTVGVVFAMRDTATGGYRVPTTAEIATLQAYLDSVKPVTADVYAVAASLLPVNVGVLASPYTATTLAAIQAALTAFFLDPASASIGFRLSNARC